MEISIRDIRKNMSKILETLARVEKVTVLYGGKIIGVIVPSREKPSRIKASQHPFFGMTSVENKPLEEVIEKIRGVN